MSATTLALASLVLALATPKPTIGQNRLSRSDSALVGRILLAEDRRDSADTSLQLGVRHADARVRVLAQRALGRIRDPKFTARDSLPPLPAPPVWPEPPWRLRYRALANQRSECPAIRAAFVDSAWPVRLRAMDLVTPACASDDVIASTLRTWIDGLPADASRRPRGQVSWHAAAHALVGLARARPEEARPRVAHLARHSQWQARVYAARAAALLADTGALRRLARDNDDNVKEAAIDALARLAGHADDAIFIAALGSHGAQAVRAAAIALKGSPRADAPEIARRTFERWVAHHNASEHDARLALLDAAGRPAGDDRPPPIRSVLPPRAIALALGADVRLRVTLSPASGGGSFVVRLRGDNAPMMAARVLELARTGYYSGLAWHRVEHDFVIQGGGPGANEYVGYRDYFRDELGTVPRMRGTVGMSTRGHDTGDAQWFVNLKDNLRLNPDFTVFAEVVDGIDVVDGILEGDVIASMRIVRGAR